MFSLTLSGQKDLLWQVEVEGWREKTGGRGGRKSKQMMVPGKRFPPLRGNSSDLNLTPLPPALLNITHILCIGINYKKDSPKTRLMFYLTISLVSEMCPNRLKQHSRADSSIRADK